MPTRVHTALNTHHLVAEAQGILMIQNHLSQGQAAIVIHTIAAVLNTRPATVAAMIIEEHETQTRHH